MSNKQKELRIAGNLCKDPTKTNQIRRDRNKILHEIRKKQIKLANEELSRKIEAIEEAPEASKMFKAVKILNQKKYENPTIHDGEG